MNELSEEAENHFVYTVKFMICMQAMRFLTNYINNDVYYGSKYQEHNFVRAGNQLTLLQNLMDKEKQLQQLSRDFFA